MKNIIFTLFFALFASVGTISALEYSGSCGINGDNLLWTVDFDNNVLTISGTGPMADFSSMSAPWQDYTHAVNTVIISEGVTSIGNYAFNNCNVMKSINIPNSVSTIGEFAFDNCRNLLAVIIPDSVTNIGIYAFNNCIRLTSIEIPNSISRIRSYTFSKCSGMTSVVIPESVTRIDGWAFCLCSSLTSVTLPASVTILGNNIFYKCTNLTSFINYAIEPQTINIDFFEEVNLSSCTLYVPAESIEAYQSANVWKNFGTIKAIEDTLAPCIIASGTCGENLTWELSCDTVLTISGTGEMEYYTSSADVPWDKYRRSITSLVIGDSVTSLSSTAFLWCRRLTSVTIPKSVTSIRRGAFAGCSGLASIVVESGNTTYDSRDNCNAIIETETNTLIAGCQTTIIPNSVTAIGASAFDDCQSLITIELPKSIKSIGEFAFRECYSLTSINIPDSVTSIEYAAFTACESLLSITIPSSVTYIGPDVFVSCSSLTSIDVVTDNANFCSVDGVLFDKNKKYLIQFPGGKQGEYIIPNSVKSIESWAFADCKGLTTVEIPYSVNSIGNYTFFNCKSLTSIINHATEPQTIDADMFAVMDLSSLTLYVPAESLEAYKTADVWKEFGTIKVIEDTPATCVIASGTCGENATWELSCDSVLTISGTGEITTNFALLLATEEYSYAWYYIKSIIVNEGVTAIGNFAFEGGGYSNLVIPESVTYIGDYAFSNCWNLTSVTIPKGVQSIGVGVFNSMSLSSINVAIDNPNYVSEDGVLFNKDKSVLIRYPASKQGETYSIPSSVSIIGKYAFESCNLAYLSSFEIPNSITTIDAYAFKSCKFTTISIPYSVISVDDGILTSCSYLSSINVAEDNPNYCSVDGVLFTKNLTKLIQYPIDKSGTSYSIPDGVITIGERAFVGSHLKDVTIPKSVATIESAAFMGGSSLESVTNYAITPQTIDELVFNNNDLPSCTLYVPTESLEAYKSADVWKEFGTIKAIEGDEKDYISIEEAIEIGMALDSMATTSELYTIEGYVINAGTFSTKQKYQTWFMADDENATSSLFQAYCCYPIDGTDTIAITNGSRVLMTGKLQKYYNKQTASFVIEMKLIPATILSLAKVDTISVAEALAIGAELADNASTSKQYTIRGYVTYIKDFTSFYIADVITAPASSYETGGFCIYRGKLDDGVELKGGMFVEITAAIKKYVSNANAQCIIENSELSIPVKVLKDAPECHITTGVCGENLTWELNCDSVLTISGTGEMYSSSSVYTWSAYRFSIQSVFAEEGVSGIGAWAYQLYRNLTSVTLSNSVTNIGDGAFNSCSSLTIVTNYATEPQVIKANVFGSNVNLSACTLYVPAESLEAYKAADVWKEFGSILPIGEEPVETEEANFNVVYKGDDSKQIYTESITLHLPVAPEIEGFYFLKWQIVAGDLKDEIVIQAVYVPNDPSSAPEVFTNPTNPAQKLVRNGNVYILTDDSRTYTITGQQVK